MFIKPKPLVLFTPTGQLKGLSGSIADRQKLATQMRQSFNQFLTDTIQKNGGIKKRDLVDFYQKTLPDVKIKVTNEDFSPAVIPVSNSNFKKIKGYQINLPFFSAFREVKIFGHTFKLPIKKQTAVNGADRISDIAHEHEHLLSDLTQPMYSLSSWPSRFCLKKLLKVGSYYKKNLYGSRRTKITKNDLSEFFDKNKFTLRERITALQSWRKRLKNEVQSYKIDAAAFVEQKYPHDNLAQRLINNEKATLVVRTTDLLDSETIKQIKKELGFVMPGKHIAEINFDSHNTLEEKFASLESFKNTVIEYQYNKGNDYFNFSDKINLIEEMLAQEIAKVREGHRQGIFQKNVK